MIITILGGCWAVAVGETKQTKIAEAITVSAAIEPRRLFVFMEQIITSPHAMFQLRLDVVRGGHIFQVA